jgi:hypothetical protein
MRKLLLDATESCVQNQMRQDKQLPLAVATKYCDCASHRLVATLSTEDFGNWIERGADARTRTESLKRKAWAAGASCVRDMIGPPVGIGDITNPSGRVGDLHGMGAAP